jgi:hypothetical protein
MKPKVGRMVRGDYEIRAYSCNTPRMNPNCNVLVSHDILGQRAFVYVF